MAAFVETLLERFHDRTPIRAGSLIVTIFGDAVVPRGGALSLESLLEITRAFRIGDGVVRTALSRLVTEGWFERWKIGRNSFYRLTPRGGEAFARATARIYGEPPADWTGGFDIVLLEGGDDRAALRADLQAAGYGLLGPDLLISASPAATGGEGAFLRLAAEAHDPATAQKLAARAWPLDAVEARYERFIAAYSGLRPALERGLPGDLDALMVRILLIHDYRRAVLKDPLLPPPLLPVTWAGRAARELCASLYLALVPPSERWLSSHARNDAGPLPKATASFRERFSGLKGHLDRGAA